MNPYQRLQIYNEDAMARYKEAAIGSLPPHVFGVAAAAYTGLLSARSQSIVISGESGAGKSETAKKVLKHLAYSAAKSVEGEEGIEKRILASSPVLEAFGNAKTSMNNNSSRYGKFLMLQFDKQGQLSGANIKTYLLEKTRVVSQGPMERGYHIGYMICEDPEQSSALRMPKAKDLTYLGRTGCLLSPGWDDKQEFADSQRSLVKSGLDLDASNKLWRIVAACLLLGELDFGPEDAAEASLANKKPLVHLCDLLDVDSEIMSKALTIKMTKAGSEWISSPNTPAKASELRHGFARSIYSTVFDWLVAQINRALRLDGAVDVDLAEYDGSTGQFIGILDIFGFETFEINSLEQLCINFCNERLQATFNEAVFNAVQEENAAEGIKLPEADLQDVDNAGVVKLIGGRPGGILHSLNEECIVPKGSDASLLGKLLETHKGNPLLKKSLKVKESFVVTHFVGEVTYLATGLLLKNKDPVSEDLMVLLQRSRSSFVQGVFAPASETKSLLAKKKDTRFQGVAAKFQKQLEELLRLIGHSHMNFIRCIKPNREKVKEKWDAALVTMQLRCSGVFEAVRVIGMGFPDRIPLFSMITQYARLVPEDDRPEVDEEGKLEGTESEAVSKILTALGIPESHFAIGTSKCFLKAGVLSQLRKLQREHDILKSIIVQRAARGWFGRKIALVRREEWRRQLEEEAAAALAAALKAEQEALEAAAALEAADKAKAAATAAAEKDAANAAEAEANKALAAAITAGKAKDRERENAAKAIRDVDAIAVRAGDGSLVDYQSRAKARLQNKIRAIARMSLAAKAHARERSAQEATEEKEISQARQLLTSRTASRKSLLGLPVDDEPEDEPAMGFKLSLVGPGQNLSSMLSHRDQGGGIAPLSSARAPQRKNVKKVTKKNKKDAQWMEMVLEYAVYLGMDPDADSELLWIAEQALRAPVPVGWEEMMDPFGDLYFFNETTSQSTRQHPMDGYYQQLYLKLRLQRAGGFSTDEPETASPSRVSVGPKKGGKKTSMKQPEQRLAQRGNESSDAISRWKKTGSAAVLTTRGPGDKEGSPVTARGGGSLTGRLTSRDAPKQKVSSISEALEMSSPRSAKFMLEKFGLNADSTEDERCLLINPAIWRVPTGGEEVPFIECVMDKDELGLGINRLSLYMVLNDNNEAFALGALKRMINQNTAYELSMSENDDEVDVHYTGKLSCNAKGNEFVMYDDLNDAIGIREGKARRELGLVLFGARQLGQCLPIELVIPRVQRDGQAAQFRPKTLGEAMIQQYKTGKTKHLFVLKGLAQLVPGGRVQLKFRGGEHSAVVFEAYRSTGDRWAVRYRHPLSAFQAFNVAIALLHNVTTQAFEMMPPLDEVPQAPAPTLSMALTTIAKLEHAYGVAYCLCVYGHRIFCGTHSGHIQQWQCPVGAPATLIEWRAHSATVYALMVAGRSLISSSRDWLLRVWDLQSLTLVATLPGHTNAVRCLCGSVTAPDIVFSGSNDQTVRVWDIATLQGGEKKRKQVLGPHRGWVRALVCSSNGDQVCSAAKEVRIWSAKPPYKLLHVLSVGHTVYCLAICRVTFGHALRDTLFAGCNRGKVRSWKLSQLSARDHSTGELPARSEGRKVRALAVHGHVLLTGDSAGEVRAWDLSTLPTLNRGLEGHKAGVRAIDVDPLTMTVFTASNDRCVRQWGADEIGDEQFWRS